MASGANTPTAPEIAENGNTEPIAVTVPGAKSITLFADGNPVPNLVTFNFGALSTSRSASMRIHLAGTQNVIAIAKMEHGTFQQATASVKVISVGCGGELSDYEKHDVASGVNPRIKVAKFASAGDTITVKTLINHKVKSGQRKDDDGNTIP